MSISDQITRLNNAKANIKQSIINKGVEVDDSVLLDQYPALIDSIETGGGNSYYEDLYNLKTSNGTFLKGFFYYYPGTELNLDGLVTSKVTDISSMFYYCQKLTSLDLSNFDTGNVTNMSYMFYYCNQLTTLDLSSFDTGNVTNMSYMFYGCYNLITLDLSSWNTSKVTDTSYMFNGCSKLKSLNLNNWDASNVTTVNSMFYNCTSLTELDLSTWKNNKISNMYNTFRECTGLISLDLSGLDIHNCDVSTSLNSTFYNCTALTNFKAPKNINYSISFSTCTNLTHDSLMSIINNLMTTTSTKTLTLGTTNLAKLTDDEKAIATNKGWTLK